MSSECQGYFITVALRYDTELFETFKFSRDRIIECFDRLGDWFALRGRYVTEVCQGWDEFFIGDSRDVFELQGHVGNLSEFERCLICEVGDFLHHIASLLRGPVQVLECHPGFLDVFSRRETHSRDRERKGSSRESCRL